MTELPAAFERLLDEYGRVDTAVTSILLPRGLQPTTGPVLCWSSRLLTVQMPFSHWWEYHWDR